MFTEKLFEYDESTHQGFYCGKLVPSITQLLEALYPLDPSVPQNNLQRAAIRGTETHKLLEKFNNAKEKESLTELLKNEDILNYYCFLKASDLFPAFSEQIVFLRDENGEIITYGHFDTILQCLSNNEFGEGGNLILCDFKTTSTFAKEKTHLQTELYKVAVEQTLNIELSDKTIGIHLRDNKIKIYPFLCRTKKETIDLAIVLKELWRNATKS